MMNDEQWILNASWSKKIESEWNALTGREGERCA